MSTSLAKSIAADVADMARDDWVGLWVLFSWVRERLPSESPANLKKVTLAVIREVLAMGLRAGDSPYSPGGFTVWPEQEADLVIRRIDNEWTALGRDPNIGDIVAFG